MTLKCVFIGIWTRYRENITLFLEVLIAIGIGFLLGGIVMEISGYDAWTAYRALLETSFSDWYYICTTLSFATPVMLTAITFAVGVRAGLFNIGAEGQMYMGALGALIVAALHIDSPSGLILALFLGMAMGILWGAIPAILKVYKGVNEVVSTIMLNWIAFWIVEYVRVYVWPNPEDPSKTIAMPPHARLPLLAKGTELSAAFIIAIIFTIITYFILWFTAIGYEVRVVGLNPVAARFAGINISRAMLIAFIIGGAAAGLAGACEVTGRPPHYAVTTGLSNLYGFGFDGITVALLGANHPIAIIPASILVGALLAGARGMQIYANVPLEMVRVVQGIIIIALAVPGIIRLLRLKIGLRRVGIE